MEQIGLLNSAICFLPQMTLLRWLTCLLRSLTVSITVLLFWIYLFLLMLVLVLQGLSFLWEILMKLSRFPLTFLQTLKGMTLFFTKLITILVLIGTVFKIIWEMFNGRLSLNLVLLLLLLLNYVSGFRLELMYISLIVNVRSSLIHLHGFQLLVLLS